MERTSPARDPWADNARLVAAGLIVVMHLLEPVLARSSTALTLYWVTWPLRVPLFVVLAGYFSDARPLDDRRTVVLLRNVLGVYLLWDLVACVRRGVVDGIWRYEPAVPAFGLWFLLALFWWRLALPVLSRVRGAGLLVCALALGAGVVPQLGQAFAGSRTFVYLPLFWAGWWLGRAGVRDLLGRVWARLVGAVALAVAGAGLLVVSRTEGRGVLRFAGPYEGAWEQQVEQAVLRALLVGLGLLGALGALAVVPTVRLRWWTTLGAGSMTVYVVHPLLVQHARSLDLFDAVRRPGDLVALVAVGVLLTIVLAAPPVRGLLRPLVQPRSTWWLAPARPAAADRGARAVGAAEGRVPAAGAAGPGAPGAAGQGEEPGPSMERGSRTRATVSAAPAPGVRGGAEGAGARDAPVAAPGAGGRLGGLVVDGPRGGEARDEGDELEVVGGPADDADARKLVVHRGPRPPVADG